MHSDGHFLYCPIFSPYTTALWGHRLAMVGLCTKPSVVQATMNSRAWSALYMMIGREREEGPRHVNMDLMMTSDDRLVQEYANMCPGYLSRIANMK